MGPTVRSCKMDRAVIRRGYERCASTYVELAEKDAGNMRLHALKIACDYLDCTLASGALHALDLGCGGCVPVVPELLRRGFNVTAVDSSAAMLRAAQRKTPSSKVRLVQADMMHLEGKFAPLPASVDIVCAFFSLFHVPRAKHATFFRQVATWLKPGGVLVFNISEHEIQFKQSSTFLGVDMQWENFSSARTRMLLQDVMISAHGPSTTGVHALEPAFDVRQHWIARVPEDQGNDVDKAGQGFCFFVVSRRNNTCADIQVTDSVSSLPSQLINECGLHACSTKHDDLVVRTGTPVQIRRARLVAIGDVGSDTDNVAIARVHRAAFEVSHKSWAQRRALIHPDNKALPGEEFPAWFAPSGHAWIAEQGGIVVGFVFAVLGNCGGCDHCQDCVAGGPGSEQRWSAPSDAHNSVCATETANEIQIMYPHIDDLFVHPDAQRQGIGTALLATAESAIARAHAVRQQSRESDHGTCADSCYLDSLYSELSSNGSISSDSNPAVCELIVKSSASEALSFYRRRGFRICEEQQVGPDGCSYIKMRKVLDMDTATTPSRDEGTVMVATELETGAIVSAQTDVVQTAGLHSRRRQKQALQHVPSWYRRKQGRGSKAQRRALRELSPTWGIKVAYREIIDLPAVFWRPPLAALLELPLHVVLDIGFGTGESLLEMARSAPRKAFLGVEHMKTGVAEALKRLNNASLVNGQCRDVDTTRGFGGNARVFGGDAVKLLAEHLADGSLAEVTCFFPDPWAHERDADKKYARRLLRPAVIQLIEQRLRPHGVLHLATDVPEYAEDVCVLLASRGWLHTSAANCATGFDLDTHVEGAGDSGHFDACAGPGVFKNFVGAHLNKRPSWRPQTLYERRALAEGRPVCDVSFVWRGNGNIQ